MINTQRWYHIEFLGWNISNDYTMHVLRHGCVIPFEPWKQWEWPMIGQSLMKSDIRALCDLHPNASGNFFHWTDLKGMKILFVYYVQWQWKTPFRYLKVAHEMRMCPLRPSDACMCHQPTYAIAVASKAHHKNKLWEFNSSIAVYTKE